MIYIATFILYHTVIAFPAALFTVLGEIMICLNFSVVLFTRAWRALGTSTRVLGDVWEFFWEAFGGRFGDFWGLLGLSWGYLGRFAAQDAPKNSRREPQELPKTAPRGPRRPRKGSQETPKKAQEAT